MAGTEWFDSVNAKLMINRKKGKEGKKENKTKIKQMEDC